MDIYNVGEKKCRGIHTGETFALSDVQKEWVCRWEIAIRSGLLEKGQQLLLRFR